MSAGRQAFLRVDGLVVRYPGVLALDGASFALEQGEIVGLLGKNGAGKSTAIKVLAGAVRAAAGSVEVDGERVEIHGPGDAAAQGFAFVHQELELIPLSSVAENVVLGGRYPTRLGGLVRWRALYEEAARVLAILESDIDPRALVDDLTPAEQRMVMIARALRAEARLVVLDEPTIAFTDDDIEHLHDVCRRIRERGGTVLYVSHRLGEITRLTDRVIVMRDGAVVETMPTAATTRASLIAAITGSGGAGADAERRRAERAHDPRRPGKTLLEARGISDRAGKVRSVDLDVRAGEIVGIGGLVGSGRTEFVRLVYGADPRDGGEIRVGGEPRAMRSPNAALAAGVALLPEDRRHEGIQPDFSLRENVTLSSLGKVCFPHTPIPAPARERAVTKRLIERLGISSSGTEQPVRELSGGNQQKAVLARCLQRGADVFIFDEPTAGIDVEAKEEVYGLIESLAAEGKGIVFISSEFSELVRICDRIEVMREGELVGELRGEQITERAIVELCYGHEAAAAPSPGAPA
ncbi:MAG TPA: sugar ABC transporter ATP-binding protein [Solirubrobacterales bacterium]|nr:sugar ABC transporter ATP-binding protein [Solirubrobacterales bacterium]